MADGVDIRTAASEDHHGVVAVVREAFSAGGRDPQEEVDIVLATWNRGASGEGLELVAVAGDTIVGHVLSAWGRLDHREVVAVAPLSVLPSHQGIGVGRALMTELLHRAASAALPLILLLGDPGYYRRFGFEPSGPLAISYGQPDNPHFLVRRFPSYDPTYRGSFTYCWEQEGDVAPHT
ncbi:MAG TPA: N-acetyltransferase [Acidimicrobiales bacterium]